MKTQTAMILVAVTFGAGFLLGRYPQWNSKADASETQALEKMLVPGPITISRTTRPDLQIQGYQIVPVAYLSGGERVELCPADPQKTHWTLTFANGKTVIFAEETAP